MFCMNCGHELPEGAKFCMQCGTPLGSVAPNGSKTTNTINLDGNHTFVPARCPNCNANLQVDSSLKIAHCNSCGGDCLVQEAINALSVNGNVQVGNATINVSGTNTDALFQRIELLLADEEFDEVKSKCNTILDLEPTNGKAYLYLLMADLWCRDRFQLSWRLRNELNGSNNAYLNNKYLKNAIQYGDKNQKAELKGYVDTVLNDQKQARKVAEEERKKAVEKENVINKNRLKNPKIGDMIKLGDLGTRDIWWKVHVIRDSSALLICDSTIANLPYHNNRNFAKWDKCTLREWLNSDFVNKHFSLEEREIIIPCSSIVKNGKPYYTFQEGKESFDKVFLLNSCEARCYFSNDKERQECGHYYWWLRSTGYIPDIVDCFGRITHISDLDNKKYGVRPAIWIKIN